MKIDQFKYNRLGLFVHWGLYSLPARHEWVKFYENKSDEDYNRYFNKWNPDLFNPEEWAETAFDAGMKYIVFTTKHHEGFCLWDTKYTDFKVTDTPYGKDILTPLVNAFRKKGFRIGLYYSLQDWHHPHYTIDQIHPFVHSLSPEEIIKENEKRDIAIYREYIHNQVRELMTEFGEIDEIWFDNSVKQDPNRPYLQGKGHEAWDTEGLVKMIRKYQPNILINDRLDGEFDFKTPENYIPAKCPTADGKNVPWEACQSLNNSWGYYRNCTGWKTPHQVISLLSECVSKDGNLLLNVGPTGRGEFEPNAKESLKVLGKWMKEHSASIYGCTEVPQGFAVENNFMTYNPKTNRLYIHLIKYPNVSRLRLKGGKNRVVYAQFLNDKSELKFIEASSFEEPEEDTMFLELPLDKPKTPIPVIELFLKE